MRYIGGDAREQGCIFCNRLERTTDVESLILYRAEHAFVIIAPFIACFSQVFVPDAASPVQTKE